MDDREFLKKIRDIQKSNQKITLTESNVISKKMLNEVRVLKEEDVQSLDPDEQREEENKFKDIVSKLVKFEKIKVHPENVEWSGHLIRERIDWVFSLDDSVGCYIKTDDFLQLRDENLEVLKKLRGYYDVWAEEWSGRLTGTQSPEEEVELETTEVEGGEEAGFGGEEAGFGGEEAGFGGEAEF